MHGKLIALYEGVDGESSYQIQRSMQLPWNRNVMRIGFRDIHRTLKTYFVPEEGFLAGLALNNENVTFTESYKKILRFYGFDLESDHSPSSKPTETPQMTTSLDNSTTTTTRTSTTSTTVSSSSTPTTIITIAEKVTSREDPSTASTKATKEETTPNPQVETLDTVDIRGDNADTPVLTTSATSTVTTTGSTSMETTTMNGSTTQMTTVSSGAKTDSLTVPSTTETMLSTDASTMQTMQMTTQESTDTTTISTDSTVTETTSTLPTTSNTEILSTGSSTMTTNTQTTSAGSVTETQQTEQISTNTETTAESSTMPTTSTLETLERRKKSVLDFLYSSPLYDDDYLVYRSFNVGTELPTENSEEDDTNFMANGLRNIQVAYMHYDSVMEYAYLPHLEASALRLPLDSERYYLLVILPVRRGSGELERLLARMARESDLSDVYAALHPRRVRAVVPSFIVKGHVTLTTDLQKIGIRDVFEPRQHDFTPMTPQGGVYVRSIEQAVSVAIRKYQPDVKNRYSSNRGPVIFSATYPFLYFVMDSNIHVALMAGKMVDPLNTRIL
ncbi:serine-rich adhesin for platelets isoform X2 [Maniola jurtina]|uniref:serine-rich adhesin for platelets isoform X2 n=1 Tax=Maniola jurtina TaxID=191418 RepID=UPI001E6889B9|nr:serine-rich adhesin for platelets isoform X2 [Maniola jurtina]